MRITGSEWRTLGILLLIGCISFVGTYQVFNGGYMSKYLVALVGYQRTHTVASFTVIDMLLHKFLVQYHIDRIGIARFRGQGTDLYFATFESMTSETDIANLKELQAVPVSDYASLLPHLLNGEAVFLRTAEMPPSILQARLVRRGVKAAIYVPIKDLSDHLTGMITAAWVDDKDVPNDQQRGKMIEELLEASDRIGAYFTASPL